MQAYRRAYRMAQVRLYSQQQQPLDAASRLTAAIIELDAASPCFAYGDGDGGGGGGDDGPPGGALFAGVGVQMKQHQLALLRRCLELENGPLTLSALASLSHRGMPDHMVEAHDHNYLRTRIGVLGDKVGSGKSYVILALVLAGRGQPPPPDPVVRSFVDNRICVSVRSVPRSLDLTLLVIPHNLSVQWTKYIRQFGGGLRHMDVNSAKHVAALRKLDRHEPDEMAALDLIVVTSTFFNTVADAVGQRRVRRVVFDEADSIALTGGVAVDACFHWFVTASWRNLLSPTGDSTLLMGADGSYARRVTGIRSSGFIKSVFNELSREAVYEMGNLASHAIVVRNSDAFVDASMVLPEAVVHTVRSLTPVHIRLLSGVVDRNIMDCLNAGDVETAMQHVSSSNRSSEDNIVALLMDKLERRCHNVRARIDGIAALVYDSDAEREAERERLAQKLEGLQRLMDCIRERVTTSNSCCICYEPMLIRGAASAAPAASAASSASDASDASAAPAASDASAAPAASAASDASDASDAPDAPAASAASDAPADDDDHTISTKTVVPCCSNAFCFTCINMWISRNATCPLCKAPTSVSQLMVVTGDERSAQERRAMNDPSELSHHKDKMGNLEAILRRRCTSPGAAKVLLFSSFDNSFTGIVGLLARLHLRHRFLKGNHFSVSAIEREYRNSTLDVLLVNTSNYGSGLNFENTTDVIMLHKFDTDIEKQVIGRAQRCGRIQPLNVWYLLYENEIERDA